MDNNERYDKLEQRLALLEDEVSRLKAQLQDKPAAQPSGEGNGPIAAESPPELPAFVLPPSNRTAETQEPFDWDSLGRVWLPRIFIAVLILGVLWAFKAGIDSQLISEPVRCLIGVLASAAMVVLGERQFKLGRAVLGQVLDGGGIVVFAVSVLAGHLLYGLIAGWPAFLLLAAATAAGAYVTDRHRSQGLGLVTIIGGSAAPLLIDPVRESVWVLSGYELVLSIAFFLIGRKLTVQALPRVSVFALHLALLLALLPDTSGVYAPWIAVLLQHAALLGLYASSRMERTNGYIFGFTTAPSLLFWSYGVLDENQYRVFLLAACAIYFMLAAAFFKEKDKFALFFILCMATISFYTVELTEGFRASVVFMLEGAALAVAGLNARKLWLGAVGVIAYALGLLLVLPDMVDGLFDPPSLSLFSAETLAWLTIAGTILWVRLESRRQLPGSGIVRALGWFAYAAVVSLATYFHQIATAGFSGEYSRMTLTLLWTIAAVITILYGVAKDRKEVRIGGVIFLLVTLFKLFLLDLTALSVAFRAVIFICIGAAGIWVSKYFDKGTPKKPDRNRS